MGKAKAPDNLSPEAQKLYRSLRAEYGGLVDVGFAVLLENVCRSLDRMRTAEATLAREGLTYLDRFDKPRPHPAAARVDRETATLERQLVRLRYEIDTMQAGRIIAGSARNGDDSE